MSTEYYLVCKNCNTGVWLGSDSCSYSFACPNDVRESLASFLETHVRCPGEKMNIVIEDEHTYQDEK